MKQTSCRAELGKSQTEATITSTTDETVWWPYLYAAVTTTLLHTATQSIFSVNGFAEQISISGTSFS